MPVADRPDPTTPGALAARDHPALDDARIAGLRPGARVVLHRYLPAAADRAAHTTSFHVQVSELLRQPEGDWVLVPAASEPWHPVDFYVGITGYGMHSWLCARC